jgi:hypothetical protein
MSSLNSTGDRLRRATQLWHATLAATGQRFELAQFLKDPAIEKRVLDAALASGDQKLVVLAQDWMRDSGQSMPAAADGRVLSNAPAAPAATPADGAKPSRYLRGVR